MANDGQKKSMVLKALDTVERVGNRLPDPAVIFLILTGIVILVSALADSWDCLSHMIFWTAQAVRLLKRQWRP